MKSFFDKFNIKPRIEKNWFRFDSNLIRTNKVDVKIGLWLNEISFDDYYYLKNNFNNLVFKSNIFFCDASHINSIPDNLKLKRLDIFEYNGELLKNKITIDKLSIWDLSYNIVSLDRINFTDDFKFNQLK